MNLIELFREDTISLFRILYSLGEDRLAKTLGKRASECSGYFTFDLDIDAALELAQLIRRPEAKELAWTIGSQLSTVISNQAVATASRIA